MNILNITPLLSLTVGVFLLAFILFRKSGLGKDKRLRYILAALVSYFTLVSFDYYTTISEDGNNWYFGISYMFYHLVGFLFYYFIALLIKLNIRFKKWLLIIIGITLLRWFFFYPLFEYENMEDFLTFLKASDYDKWLLIEYLLVSLFNILLFFLAFYRLRQAPTALVLNKSEALKYKWAKLILITFVIFQVGIFINQTVSGFSFVNYEVSLKFESLLIAIFFFIFAYSIMHFPVFAFSGDFEDLPEEAKKKYAKSSLKDSSELFNEIKILIKEEQLFLDFDLKLNTLSERLGSSVHHISQAINQNAGMSFPDFINSFRIEEAKKKLLMPKPDTIFAISLDVGFNSKAAFYTAFKKVTSQTPTEFKKASKA
ncbi:helix-turn-helix domain-containing protein [Leptobacterium flavescens]|uniref:Helix-turn-helix domain-containing protein n=1 Tax=Leptobacterium flavescens TaxID=472055 RepID=A0A6P0USB3_9FLAO|nr:AraC family transcriptional regulator [Leptobacterium flavescens]NER14878.1 helix-turn-helix domain-containing protein [Leptobacterium flavescens]